MSKKAYRMVLLCALFILAGCVARNDPLFGPHIRAADQAIENARKRGVDKQDPAKFQALVKLRDDAEKIYMSCDYYTGKKMAQQVVAQAKTLKGLPKVAVKKAPVKVKKSPVVPKAVKTTAGDIPKLGAVLFEFDRTRVRPSFYPVLDRAVFLLKSAPGLRMNIEGHADSVGTVPYNQALSKLRAGEAKKYIVKKGVSGDRLSIKAFGENNPAASNGTKAGRAKNRRVMLKPVGKFQGKTIGEN